MSISILTESCTRLIPRVVFSSVCGISDISTISLWILTTVKLIPSIAIEPFCEINGRRSLFSIWILILLPISPFSIFFISPVPSTCPNTKWPSNLPPTRILLSIFTLSPSFNLMKLVLFIVSSIT